jgi:gluconolactonase
MSNQNLCNISQQIFSLELPFPDGNEVLTQLIGPKYCVHKLQLPQFYIWGESPTYIAERQLIIFADVTGRTLNYYNIREQKIVKVIYNTPYINGLFQINCNTLVGCAAAPGSLVLIDINTGKITPYVLGYEGKPFNSPNDIIGTYDKQLLIFSDPPIGCNIPGYGSCYPGPPPQNQNRIYIYDRKTKIVKALIDDLISPNGVVLSKDEKILYAVDLKLGTTEPSVVYKYDFDRVSQTVSNKTLFYTNTTELLDGGLKIDQFKNIWVTTFRGIRVLTPEGIDLGQMLFPTNITNLTFVNEKYVYATGRYNLYFINPDFIKKDL